MQASPRSAELAAARILTVGIALVTVFVAVGEAFVVRQTPNFPSGFAAAAAAMLIIPVAAGIAAPFVDLRWIRSANAATAVSHIAVAVVWASLSDTVALDESTASAEAGLPWLLTTTSRAVVAGVIAAGPLGGFVTILLLEVAFRAAQPGQQFDQISAIASDIEALAVAIASCMLASAVLATAAARDSAARQSELDATAIAAERGRAAIQRATHAMVHDEILATLLLASRGRPEFQDAVATRARVARGLIDGLGAATAADLASLSATEFILRVEAETLALDPLATIERPADEANDDAVISGDAGEAMIAALRQAVHNSLTHAGVEARRRVTITASSHGTRTISVMIADDGCGFVPSEVASHRMGIAVSITGRLAEIAGGSATTVSSPGEGTTVTLSCVAAGDASAGRDSGATGTGDVPGTSNPADSTAALVLPGARLGGMIFVILQIVMAGIAADQSELPMHATISALCIIAAICLMHRGHRTIQKIGIARAVLICFVAIAGTVLPIVGATPDDADLVWEIWYLTPLTVALIILAIRGRAAMAVVTWTIIMVGTTAGLLLQGSGPAIVAVVIARPVTIMFVGTLSAVLVVRMLTSVAQLQADRIAQVTLREFEAAGNGERQARSRHLVALVGPILQVLASGRALDEAEVRECVALEGRLRDDYRGGALVQQPLTEAAMMARRRGVDVRILDDRSSELTPETLVAVVAWMHRHLDNTPAGSFVGRLLPTGRSAVATVVVNRGESQARHEFSA